jgi:hypothetical protein
MAGAEIETIADAESLERSFSAGLVVMVCLLGRSDPISSLPLREVVPVARRWGIPILVDAAGLRPDCPDPWLAQGADIVVYSGGKYLRGPQSTGLLLGSERLCRAAWLNGAPHQAFGRSMKVGKEEIVGAVTALERWMGSSGASDRDHWGVRLGRISGHVRRVRGVSADLLASSPSVTAERLRISWDHRHVPFTSEDLRAALLEQRPRILLHDFWAGPTSVVIDPVNLSDREADMVGRALATAFAEGLGRAGKPAAADPPAVGIGDAAGDWTVEVRFLHGAAEHVVSLRQDGARLTGRHKARFSEGTVEGEVVGRHVRLKARHSGEPMVLYYALEGELDGDVMAGALHLGAASDEHRGPVFESQFGEATWSARRAAEGRVLPSWHTRGR